MQLLLGFLLFASATLLANMCNMACLACHGFDVSPLAAIGGKAGAVYHATCLHVDHHLTEMLHLSVMLTAGAQVCVHIILLRQQKGI